MESSGGLLYSEENVYVSKGVEERRWVTEYIVRVSQPSCVTSYDQPRKRRLGGSGGEGWELGSALEGNRTGTIRTGREEKRRKSRTGITGMRKCGNC